jgi:phosphoribosylformylglycinamidine synthase
MNFEGDKMKKKGAYNAPIEKVLLGDLQLRRAYSDYLATRNVMQEKGDVCLADLATTPLRFFKQRGRLDKLNKLADDGSAAVKINVQVGGENEPWLLLLKTAGDFESCVKKTEAEGMHPYVAARVSAAANPTEAGASGEGSGASMEDAAEFASKAEELGVSAALVDEIYHPVYEAGRTESCALAATVPAVELVARGGGSFEEPDLGVSYFIKTEDGAAEAEAEDAASDAVNINFRAAADWKKSPLYDESLRYSENMRRLAEDLNVCSKRGLTDRFDSTIGSGSVLMPLGGMNQLTPAQAAVHKLPTTHEDTEDCTLLSFGFNPYIFDASPYHGAYLGLVEAVSRLVASGASFNEVYLALHQNFGSSDAERTGEQLAALLGVFEAEMGLGICSIGGDAVYEPSDSGRTGEAPSLITYALTTGKVSDTCSPEFKAAGHKIVMLNPDIDEDEQSAYFGLPNPKSLISVWRKAYELIANGKAVAAYAPGIGGVAEAIMKMSYGNGIGFEFSGWEDELSDSDIFGYSYGSIILEMVNDDPVRSRSVNITTLGYTTEQHAIRKGDEALSIGELLMLYEGRLESVFPSNADSNIGLMQNVSYAARSWPTPIFKRSVPKFLIPKFEKTTGAADLARAAEAAGGAAEILEIGSGAGGEAFAEALFGSQILCLAGGRVGLSDEIVRLLGESAAQAALTDLLDKRDGLVLGLGGGFKALIELGLLPGGAICANNLGAYQSRIARVRVASNKSPWFRDNKTGDIFMMPVSTSEGRFEAPEELIKRLAINGQIATQFVDKEGLASSDIRFNPGGSMMAIESITSEDGRVLGRIGCADRIGRGLYRNVPGNYFSGMFENAMRYFR